KGTKKKMSESNKKTTASLHTKGLSKKDINSMLVQKALTELKRKDNGNEEEKKIDEIKEENQEPKGAVLSVQKEELIKNSIQILSDIHLECDNVYESMPKIHPKAPIVALLGNIGYPQDKVYVQFMEELSKNFQHVLVL
ncbi:hypothetical protein RFI_33668, partial [Reticulomyxa filosa]